MTTASRSAAETRPASRRVRVAVIIVAAVAILLAVGALTLAQPILDVLHKQHRESFSSRSAAESGWVGVPMPTWIPAGATDVRNLATTDETNAIIRVDTTAEPVGCTTGERHAMPSLTADWAPAISNAGGIWEPTVWRCGPYEVITVDGGLFGWFEARTRGATPETQTTA